jgi:streptogrisin C
MSAMIAAYMDEYPGIGETRARQAASNQGARVSFLNQIAARDINLFGGSWYDPQIDTMHVFATTNEMSDRVVTLAKRLGVLVAVELAPYSYPELEELAASINGQRDATEAKNNAVYAGADGRWNQVTVVVSDPALVTKVQQQFSSEPRVRVVALDEATSSNTSCTSRTACGSPARSGIVIGIDADGAGSGSATQECSLGFTAAASDGSKWIVTAGHCSHGVGSCPSSTTCWGHGQQFFGPLRDVIFDGNLDAARIRKDNSYWATGGYIYNGNSPDNPVDVDVAIIYRTSMQQGDTVCLAAWHSSSGADCGIITNLVSVLGMVETSLQACSGDSGGGWYAPMSGLRWAYGIQSRADDPHDYPNCHTSGKKSYFSALPDINAYWDSHAAATIRVETR